MKTRAVSVVLLLSFATINSIQAQVSVSGQVLNAPTGEALAGMHVSIGNEWHADFTSHFGTITDEEGRFRLEGIEPGSYTLVAKHVQDVAGFRLSFRMPTRALRVDSDDIVVRFLFVPLTQQDPVYGVLSESRGELANITRPLPLQDAWLSKSGAHTATGDRLSFGGGHFEIAVR